LTQNHGTQELILDESFPVASHSQAGSEV
jgi:hypothetical protein